MRVSLRSLRSSSSSFCHRNRAWEKFSHRLQPCLKFLCACAGTRVRSPETELGHSKWPNDLRPRNSCCDTHLPSAPGNGGESSGPCPHPHGRMLSLYFTFRTGDPVVGWHLRRLCSCACCSGRSSRDARGHANGPRTSHSKIRERWSKFSVTSGSQIYLLRE